MMRGMSALYFFAVIVMPGLTSYKEKYGKSTVAFNDTSEVTNIGLSI